MEGELTHYVGRMQCFCTELKEDKKPIDIKYNFTLNGTAVSQEICP